MELQNFKKGDVVIPKYLISAEFTFDEQNGTEAVLNYTIGAEDRKISVPLDELQSPSPLNRMEGSLGAAMRGERQ